jgi:hypothetical protein
LPSLLVHVVWCLRPSEQHARRPACGGAAATQGQPSISLHIVSPSSDVASDALTSSLPGPVAATEVSHVHSAPSSPLSNTVQPKPIPLCRLLCSTARTQCSPSCNTSGLKPPMLGWVTNVIDMLPFQPRANRLGVGSASAPGRPLDRLHLPGVDWGLCTRCSSPCTINPVQSSDGWELSLSPHYSATYEIATTPSNSPAAPQCVQAALLL